MSCSNCGASNNATQRFCRKCGTPTGAAGLSTTAPAKSNAELAAGAFRLISDGAAPPAIPAIAPKGPTAPTAQQSVGAQAGGVVASFCVAKVLQALHKEEAAQAALNSKFNAVVRMFVGKSAAIQPFLSWVAAQAEGELVDKLTFARSKVGADNPAFASLVPVVCPELTDLASLAKNNAEKFETLYWSIMGEALELLLMGNSQQLAAVPVPKVDPAESPAKQQYARTMQQLKEALEATKPGDDPAWDALLQQHRVTGGDAVVMIFEHYLKAHSAPPEQCFIFRRLRNQLLFRFFVLLLSFYLNEKDAVKGVNP